MSNEAHDKTRRRFLTESGKLALAAGAATAATHLAGRAAGGQGQGLSGRFIAATAESLQDGGAMADASPPVLLLSAP